MENDFDFFVECLKKAAKRVDSHYFQLPIAGLAEPKPRERVYAYELYHQLRCILGDMFPYKLDGEVDKRAHPYIEPELGSVVPDLIVHEPGRMNRNLVVVEIKSVRAPSSDLEKDVSKLKDFISKAGYHRGVMLVYGNVGNSLPKHVVRVWKALSGEYIERILLLWHRVPHEEPVQI